MKVQARVISGGGRLNAAIATAEAAHAYAQFFGHVVPGTFNLSLPTPHRVVADMLMRLPGVPGVFIVQRCRVENLDAFIVAQSEAPDAQPALTEIEVVAAYPLRRFFRLRDGDTVTLTLADPSEPSNSKGRQ